MTSRTILPAIRCSIGFAMSEERVERRAKLLALAGHDVDRIVQQVCADLVRRIGHKNAGRRMSPHQDGKRAEVILVRVRNQDGIEFPAINCLQVGQGGVSFVPRMHPAIEDQTLSGSLKIV